MFDAPRRAFSIAANIVASYAACRTSDANGSQWNATHECRPPGGLNRRLAGSWPMFPRGIGDFHVAVQPDAQFTAQDIDLLRLHFFGDRNGVEPKTVA